LTYSYEDSSISCTNNQRLKNLFGPYFFLDRFLKQGVFGRKKVINRNLCGTLVDDPESAPPLGAALLFYQISPKKAIQIQARQHAAAE
jgi:hypothetical protein